MWRLLIPVSEQPTCGNHIVEEGEECDVGHDESDACCYSATHPVGVQCRLKPGKVCRCHSHTRYFRTQLSPAVEFKSAPLSFVPSPSQGLCCRPNCEFQPAGQTCDEETDCQEESVCPGSSPDCPEPGAKENLTVCSLGTRVCLNGVRQPDGASRRGSSFCLTGRARTLSPSASKKISKAAVKRCRKSQLKNENFSASHYINIIRGKKQPRLTALKRHEVSYRQSGLWSLAHMTWESVR